MGGWFKCAADILLTSVQPSAWGAALNSKIMACTFCCKTVRIGVSMFCGFGSVKVYLHISENAINPKEAVALCFSLDPLDLSHTEKPD